MEMVDVDYVMSIVGLMAQAGLLVQRSVATWR